MNQMPFTVEFIRTEVLDHNHYVDLVNVDGQLKTMVVGKIAEPNHFQLRDEYDGDCVEDIIEQWKDSDSALAS